MLSIFETTAILGLLLFLLGAPLDLYRRFVLATLVLMVVGWVRAMTDAHCLIDRL
jgi:hypothetical protein